MFSRAVRWVVLRRRATASGRAESSVAVTRARSWDLVDEASAESFPASDPPGYYDSHASTEWEVTLLEPPARRYWLAIGAGAFVLGVAVALVLKRRLR